MLGRSTTRDGDEASTTTNSQTGNATSVAVDANGRRCRRKRTRGGRQRTAAALALASACACAWIRVGEAGGAMSAVMRAVGGGGGGDDDANAAGKTRDDDAGKDADDAYDDLERGAGDVDVEDFDPNARESETAAAIRRGERVKLSKTRMKEMTSGAMMAMYGGVGEDGETTNAFDVLAGSGQGDYLMWCHSDALNSRVAPKIASFGHGVYSDDSKVVFHGGYKIWENGSEFEDLSSTHAFNLESGRFECLAAGADADEDVEAALGKGKGVCPKLHGASTGKRDEEVAVITAQPIVLPAPMAKHNRPAAALGKHMSKAELPALDVDDDSEQSSSGDASASAPASEEKQHAMIIFGGRDENDDRLDTVYALGLKDKQWRQIQYEGPDKRDEMVPQGPFEMPLIVKNEHARGKLFPLGRSGATAVVTKKNKMVIYGGFVVEGRLGFNVGETLVLDLNKMKFSYPMVSGNLPVRRNKHSAVLDDKERMWIWGGSVWDHTGGSSTYASTATYYADLGDTKNIVWHRVETKGKPPSQRRFHTAIIMDGGMYIIGGEDYRTRTYLGDVHRLDLTTFTWTQPAVIGGIDGGRIRSSVFPWSMKAPDAAKASDEHETHEKRPEAALGKSHHHHEADEDESEARAERKEHEEHKKHEKHEKRDVDEDEDKSKDEEDDDAPEVSKVHTGTVIDVSTCGSGEQARVRTGENQPNIEHLISVLVDGSTLASNHSSKHHSKEPETAASLAASLAKNGWLANTARGASILSESSMVWRKAPGVGNDESIPGWVSDNNGRDKSLLTETLAADPEADKIESRLIEAVKASAAASKLHEKHHHYSAHEEKSHISGAEEEQNRLEKQLEAMSHGHHHHEHTTKAAETGLSEEEEKEKSSSSKHSHSSHADDDDKSDSHKHAAHKSSDEEHHERTTHRHTDDEDDEEETSKRHHHHSSHKDDEEPVHLSGAAKMLQRIQQQNQPEASLGRTSTVEPEGSRLHVWTGAAAIAIFAATIAYQSRRRDEETSGKYERIPLVPSSASLSETPSGTTSTWQKDAMARRGMHYASDFDEVC